MATSVWRTHHGITARQAARSARHDTAPDDAAEDYGDFYDILDEPLADRKSVV